ncbi:hypothetical protein G6F44_008199 [Rhizopus delemar]|nr:hypothetical protein G6F44_008199 [Rhizopus delemar]
MVKLSCFDPQPVTMAAEVAVDKIGPIVLYFNSHHRLMGISTKMLNDYLMDQSDHFYLCDSVWSVPDLKYTIIYRLIKYNGIEVARFSALIEKRKEFKLSAKVFNELAKRDKLPLSRKGDGSFTISASDVKISIQANSTNRTTAVYSKVQPNKLNYVGQAVPATVNVVKIPPKSQKIAAEKKVTDVSDLKPSKNNNSSSQSVKKETTITQNVTSADTLSSQTINSPLKPNTPSLKNPAASPPGHTKTSADERLQEERKRIRNMTEELANAKKARQTKLIDIETAAAIDRSISDAKRSKPLIKKGKKPDHGFYTPPLTKQPPTSAYSGSYTPPATSLQTYSENISSKKASDISSLSHSRVTSHDSVEPSKKHRGIETTNQDTATPPKLHKTKQVMSSYTPTTPTSSSVSPEQHRSVKRKPAEAEILDDEPPETDKNVSLYDRVRYQLALGAFTVPFLSKLCKVSTEEIESAAGKVGIRLSNPRDSYCLRPQMYSKLEIWEWPFYTDTDRAKVIKNALEAYKLLKIPKSDPIYDNLTRPNSKSLSTSPSSISSQKAANAKKRSKMEEQRRRMLNPSKRGLQSSSSSISKNAKNTKLSVPSSKLDSPSSTKNSRMSLSPYRLEDSTRAHSPRLSTDRSDLSMSPSIEETDRDSETHSVKMQHSTSSLEHTPVPDKVHNMTPPEISYHTSSLTSPHFYSPSYSPTKDKEGAITPMPSDASPATTSSSDPQDSLPVVSLFGSSSYAHLSTDAVGREAIIKVPDQKRFNAYCRKYIREQKMLRELKLNIVKTHFDYLNTMKSNYEESEYEVADVAESYIAKVDESYLQNDKAQQQDIDAFDELLNEMYRKKERLLYMRTVIKENIKELKYKVPKECMLQQMEFYDKY